jgi:hypothetical protein
MRVESVGSGSFGADLLWLKVRGNYNLITIRSPSAFCEKSVEFDSRRLQIIEKKASRMFETTIGD